MESMRPDKSEHCPRCAKPMKLERTFPGVGAFLHELQTFRCDGCGEVLTVEADRRN